MTFFDEINQQPQALRDWMSWSANPDLVKPAQEFIALHSAARVIFTGMGSSLFAAMAAVHHLQKQGLNSLALDAQEVLSHYASLLRDDTLIIMISQSGTSAEPVCLARRLQGRYIAVTNQPASPLAQLACCVMPLCSGEERHTTSKTYTNSLAAARTLACWILGESLNRQQIWQAVSEEMARLIKDSDQYLPPALASIKECASIAVIGSGASLANACQAQLVLTEVAHLAATAYTPGQFLHGPIEAIDHRFAAIVLDSPDMKGMSANVIDEIVRYQGQVIRIGAPGNDRAGAGVTHIPIQSPAPDLAYVSEIVPIELLANKAGLAKGLQPGRLLRTEK